MSHQTYSWTLPVFSYLGQIPHFADWDPTYRPCNPIQLEWEKARRRLSRLCDSIRHERQQRRVEKIYREAGWQSFMDTTLPLYTFTRNVAQCAVDILHRIGMPISESAYYIWENWYPTQRRNYLQTLATSWSQELGLPIPTIRAVPRAKNRSGEYIRRGVWDSHCEIRIFGLGHYKNDYADTLDIMAHELLGHGSQYQLMRIMDDLAKSRKLLECGKVPLWQLHTSIEVLRLNAEFYYPIDPSLSKKVRCTSHDPYYIQPMEVHAYGCERIFAEYQESSPWDNRAEMATQNSAVAKENPSALQPQTVQTAACAAAGYRRK